MKKFFIILFAAFFAVSGGLAIDLKKIPPVQNGGTRTAAPVVVADLDNGIITVSIANYYGDATIEIVGPQSIHTEFTSEGHTKQMIDVSRLSKGTYSIYIMIENSVYLGTFEI